MEPMSVISIIGLLCNYYSLKSRGDIKGHGDFMEWLEKNNYDEALKLLQENHKLSDAIISLSKETNEVLNKNFEFFDKTLSNLASQISGFSEIVKAIHPGRTISDQAISILKQLYESGGASLIEKIELRSNSLGYQTNNGFLLQFDEPRFIEDDLNTLLELGLLIEGTSKNQFYFTRNAISFVEQLEEPL